MQNDTENYASVAQRLEQVVRKLEAGDLSLEESLQSFEEGIGLVRRGEKLLSEAEKRIEQLLTQGGRDKVIPLAVKEPENEEDIPF